jgi:glycosylphosphatidylinositol transamidase
MLPTIFTIFAVLNSVFPVLISKTLTHYFHPTNQQYTLIKAFSLLLLGMYLSALATLNFSLAFLVGLLSAPLTYITPLSIQSLTLRSVIKGVIWVFLNFLAPTTVLVLGARGFGLEGGVGGVLKEAAFGWDVWGMNTQVVVWCVWWPAWVVGMILLFGEGEGERSEGEGKAKVRI